MDNAAMSTIFATEAENPHLGGYIPGGDAYTRELEIKKFLTTFIPDLRSVLDIGCGDGAYMDDWVDLGLSPNNVMGLEGLAEGVRCSRGRGFNCFQYDFTTPYLPHVPEVDLGWCVEVVEHVEQRHLHKLIDVFLKCRFVAMTFAQPGQEGWHHVNCQREGYWRNALFPWFKHRQALSSRARNVATGHGKRILIFERS